MDQLIPVGTYAIVTFYHVLALSYPKEGHAFFSQEACNDLSLRILDWFDYYLKGEKGVEWIEKIEK